MTILDGPATVFDAIRADDQLVEHLRRNRTSPPDVAPPSRRLAAALSQWQREIDADPFPAILLDEVVAAARRGAQNTVERPGVPGTPDPACAHAYGPNAGQESPPTFQEDPMLDAPTGPVRRVEGIRLPHSRRLDPTPYTEWINSPLEDTQPDRFNVLGVAMLIALGEIAVIACAALVLLWALT